MLVIALLMAGITGIMLVLNLVYITRSQLRGVELQLARQRDHIYSVLEAAVLHSKEKDPVLAVTKDSRVRAALQASVDNVGALHYAAVVDDSGTPLAIVNIGRASLLTSEEDLQTLLDSYSFMQMGSLLWGGNSYQYSFPAALGRKKDGTPLIFNIRFGVPAARLRSELADLIFTNLAIVILGLALTLVVASGTANMLLKPVETLVTQIEKLERGEVNIQDDNSKLGAFASAANKLQMLSKRLAGERTELETTRGRLTQIIGNIEERLLLLNADGRVMLMSPRVDHLLGVPGVDLSGARLEDMIGSSHPVVELIKRAGDAHGSMEQVILIEQNGAGPRQVLSSVQYIEDKGDPIGMLVSLRDFDSFRQFQSQLDTSDKLAALGRITSGVAHEVKNPLNAMVIHLEILRAKLAQPGADFTPQLDILSSEIKRLDRVVQTFLNFTRPVHINLVPIDLNDLVHQVTRLAAAEGAATNVELREELSPEFLRVNGDADLLKQTLLNIIINGCQAMPQGGPLDIKTKRVGNYAVITIKDRGVGIPPDLHDKIFKLYYTTKEKGNGIGLAQAFRAVQLHNGRIEFDSAPDVGTTFRISLPEV